MHYKYKNDLNIYECLVQTKCGKYRKRKEKAFRKFSTKTLLVFLLAFRMFFFLVFFSLRQSKVGARLKTEQKTWTKV
jgi:hypothetical protein